MEPLGLGGGSMVLHKKKGTVITLSITLTRGYYLFFLLVRPCAAGSGGSASSRSRSATTVGEGTGNGSKIGSPQNVPRLPAVPWRFRDLKGP
jgi:hypothetical protein